MLVSRAIAQRLSANGIDTVFTIPGGMSLPLNEAIKKEEGIRTVVARHETALTHEAWGYAESTDRIAATLVVPGPGDMNAMNGLKSALNDCTPMLHLSAENAPEVRGGDDLHEAEPDTYDNVVKENIHVKNAASAAAEVQRAITIAQTPPKGPVRVGIPHTFFTQDIDNAEYGPMTTETVTGVPEEKVDAAADLLDGAEAPLIFAGGGVSKAGGDEALHSLMETLDAPVVTSRKSKGVVPEDDPHSLGVLSTATPELREVVANSDVLLAVGTDLDARETNDWKTEFPPEIIHATLIPDDIGTGYQPSVGMVADAKDVLEVLDERLDSRETGGAERAQYVQQRRKERLTELEADEPVTNSVSAIGAVREALPRDAVVNCDAGGLRSWSLLKLEAYGARNWITTGSWGSMGTSLPAAIGAKIANPDRPVLALAGDGGTFMAIHELHTAVEEEIPIIMVVLNNNNFAIISHQAGRGYDLDIEEYAWPDTAPVSFRTIAEGIGMNATVAETPDEVIEAVRDAIDSDEPELIEVPVEPNEPQASTWLSQQS